MANIMDYISDEKYIRLNSVNFEYIYKHTKKTDNIELKCYDDYKEYFDEDKIIITVSRYVDFEPKEFFTAKVSYDVIHELIPDKIEEFKEKSFDLKHEIENNLEYFIPDEMDRVSLIISQLTDSFEGRPLITSPKLNLQSNN